MLNGRVFCLGSALCCATLGCLAPTPTATPVSQVIGSAGGTVSASDGTTVTIPAGALASNVTITLTPMPNLAAPSNVTWVGTPYSLDTNGTQFAQSVTVTVPFSSSLFPAGSSASQVAVYTAPEGSTSFTALSSTVVESTDVQAQTMHVSLFGPGSPSVASCNWDGGTFAFIGRWSGTTTASETFTSGPSQVGGGNDSEVTVASSCGFAFQSFFSLVLVNCVLPWTVTGPTTASVVPGTICQDTSGGSWTFESGTATLNSAGSVVTVETAGSLVDPVNGSGTFTTTSTRDLQ
jgi:hypothetical protein